MSQNGSDPHEVGEVKIIATSDKGLCVAGDIITELTGEEEVWIPRSGVHADSPLTGDASKDDEGVLIVQRWLARKAGFL